MAIRTIVLTKTRRANSITTPVIYKQTNSRAVAAHNLNKVILIQSNHCMAIFCHNILTDDSKNLHILVTKACESQDIN